MGGRAPQTTTATSSRPADLADDLQAAAEACELQKFVGLRQGVHAEHKKVLSYRINATWRICGVSQFRLQGRKVVLPRRRRTLLVLQDLGMTCRTVVLDALMVIWNCWTRELLLELLDACWTRALNRNTVKAVVSGR
jgi:hypothetical protein